MKIIRLLGILFLVLMLSQSCKTYKNLDKVKPKSESATLADGLQKLKPGNRIKVFEKNGKIWTLDYVNTEEGILKGLEIKKPKGAPISIKVEDIEQVQVKKADVKSTAISTGLAVAIGALAFIFGLLIYMGSQAS